MDPLHIALLTILMLMVAILMGVHVGVALAAISLVGMWWITGNFYVGAKLLATTSYKAVMDYIFGVVPMFVLMGLLANLSGASKELYNSANAVFGRMKGGLGIATVMANAVFAAITGVSVASAAVFSKIAMPQMSRLGYNKRFALGTVAGSSVLGMLIPPSILLIIYGVLAEEAIGKLFMAGIIPGLLMTLVLSAGIYIMVLARPQIGGNQLAEERGGLSAFLKPWAFIVLIGVVLGGIYAGFFTPTEAGAIGAFGAFILVILKGRMNLKTLWSTLLETGYTTASIFFLLISAQMYSRMLTISGLPAETSEWVTSLPVAPIVIIIMFVLIFVMLGAILDSTSILLVTIPLLLPVVKSLNYDVIWFGVVSVVAVEMGLLTPPFGMVVYAMKASLVETATLEDIFAGSFPFLLMILLVLILLIMFPWLSVWLPSFM
jgi:C4-dicarboxylate transporter, DctM subunit